MSFNQKMANTTGDIFIVSNGSKDKNGELVSFEVLLEMLSTSPLCPTYEFFGENKPCNWQPILLTKVNAEWVNGLYFTGQFADLDHSFNVLIKPNSPYIQVLNQAIVNNQNTLRYKTLAFEMFGDHIKLKHSNSEILVSPRAWDSIQNGRHYDLTLKNSCYLGDRFSSAEKHMLNTSTNQYH
ncbi:MAG: hypothetical protein HRU38_07070 [Saccharospirillaceae bacterium]|nr:hypothetical protein [Saccharospirillaceae bacterium]